MTYQEVVLKAQMKFKTEDRKHACLWLFLELLNIDTSTYYLNLGTVIEPDVEVKYNELILKYLNDNIPVQYLIGHSYFYGRKFYVNEETLIPRGETDLLVDKTLKLIKEFFPNNKTLKILDIGTGSGCIGLTLKLELKDKANITLSDISADALKVARDNAIKYNLDVSITESNWFENIEGKYDLIIANPPYIPTSYEVDEVVSKEPGSALYSGLLGIDSYEAILSKVSKYLNPKSMIAFEHGYDQHSLLKDLANKYLPKYKVIQENDLNDLERYTFIFKEDD